MFPEESRERVLWFLLTYPLCWHWGLRLPLPQHTAVNVGAADCMGKPSSAFLTRCHKGIYQHPHSLFLALCLFAVKTTETEISTLLRLFPHLHRFVSIPKRHCPYPRACLARKENQKKTSRKRYANDVERKVSCWGWVKCGSLFWMFVNVQRTLSWLRSKDVLFDGYATENFRKVSPFFIEGEWQKSINLAYHPTITAIYSVLFARSPIPATKQKHCPCLYSEET